MTLIELLVVITILTTLVAGVIPLLSPNNDSRKIHEASRQLTSYITLAQAQAAVTGRPHGVYFKKLAEDTGQQDDRGVCLEVYQIEQPPAFVGFSTDSTVNVTPIASDRYWVRLWFGSGTANFVPNNFEVPTQFLRPGDIVEIDGSLFKLVRDTPQPVDSDPNDANDEDDELEAGYFDSPNGYNDNGFRAEWINDQGQLGPHEKPDANNLGHAYRILRLPMRSAETPLQMPSGVCVDLQGSGLPTITVPSCCHNPIITTATSDGSLDDADPNLTNNNAGIAVMFKTNGTIDEYYWNSANVNDVAGTVAPAPSSSRVHMLVGRRENVPVAAPNLAAWDFANQTEDQHDEARDQINWLNADSRWVVVGSTSGRVLATGNRYIDLTDPQYSPSGYTGSPLGTLMQSVPAQLKAVRQYAREMRREGGS